eukprot:c21736_g1_i1 orf=449-1435(-)
MSEPGTKVETTARLAQWKIENLASWTFKRSEPFRVGLWNWHLSIERNRFLYVRLFPELCRVSKESPPIASFVLRLFNVGGNRRPWTSPVYDKLLRSSDDFVWPVDTTFHGRFIIDVEFLDLKVASMHGGEAQSIWPNEGAILTQAHSGVLKCLNRMLDDGIHTDVTIHTRTGSIGAHRAVLAARSPVFESMFMHDLREKVSSTISIEDISLDAFQALLRFIYGSIKLEDFQTHRVELLRASDKYDIQDLKEACEESLLEDIDSNNVLERLQDAWLYRLDKLKRGCLRYLLDFGKIYDVREDLNLFLQHADRDLILEVFQELLDVLRVA